MASDVTMHAYAYDESRIRLLCQVGNCKSVGIREHQLGHYSLNATLSTSECR